MTHRAFRALLLCLILVISLPAAFSVMAVPGAAATLATAYTVDAPDTVEVGEEFEVAISSVNWETETQGNSETYESDPCFGPGIDLDETPDLVYTTTNVDVIDGNADWTAVGGVVGYEWTATVEAIDTGSAMIQFAVICDDGTREAIPVEVEVVAGDDGSDNDGPGDGDGTGDDDDPTPITSPGGSPIENGTDDGDEENDEDDDEGLLDAIREGFSDSLTDATGTIISAIRDALFQPFLDLVKQLITAVATVLTWTPAVDPNPAVEDVHETALRVAIMFALLGFLAAGILYQIGPLFGISYQEVRWILPRLIAALMFATVSLPILQLFVDLTNATTHAFKPPMYDTQLSELVGTGVSLVLVWVLNAFALVGVLVVYLVRGAYILFIAAISPLIAVFWALPRTRRYAAMFISSWFAALAMAPLAMLVLRFTFALMQADGATAGQAVSNWMYGLAAFTLLLFIPYQLHGAAMAVTMTGFRLGGSLGRGSRQKYRQYRSRQRSPDKLQDLDYLETMEMRELQRQHRSSGNRYQDIEFDYPGGDPDTSRGDDRGGGPP